MHRDVYDKLVKWSKDSHRKPLILRGARQVGKTHALRWLGQSQYKNTVQINFEKDPLIGRLFDESLDPKILLSKISGYLGQEIKPNGETLLIFDEIQECNAALNSLKYFCEEAPEYHISAAGSLLGVKLSTGRSFPVGKVDFIELFPLSFFEFLEANKSSGLKKILEDKNDLEPLNDAFHQKLLSQLKNYFLVGGMPEVVSRFVQDGEWQSARKIQEAILTAYQSDFSKHAPAKDIPKISLIWNSIPAHLARENKRFIFSAVRKGARGRDFESALQWLKDAGLIHFCHRITKPAFPLKAYTELDIFKVYALDIGLLAAHSNLPMDVLYRGSNVFEEFHGAFVENFVAQELAAKGMGLHYWESEGQAEIDFICHSNTSVFPLEVKAGINVKSKSLRTFQEKYPKIEKICRTNLLNFQKAGAIENIPLYAITKSL